MTSCAARQKPIPAPPPSPEAVLERQPALPQQRPFAAPVPRTRTLANGLTVIAVPRPGAKLEAVGFVARFGSDDDDPGLAGGASLLFELLRAGAAGQSAPQIAARAAALGSRLEASVGADASYVALAVLPEHAAEAARLLGEVVTRPNLDARELARLAAEREAELAALREEPRHLASIAFAATAYGSHPYGTPPLGTPETVARLGEAHLRALYRRLAPDRAALVLVGPLDADAAFALARPFEAWKVEKPGPTVATPGLPSPGRPRLVLVEKAGAPQTVLRVGEPSEPRGSPDYLALRVANTVLGGSFTSRLNQNLREQHGYTYGARSTFDWRAGPGPFYAESAVKTDVTGAALGEMLGELRRAAEQPLGADELEKGKALVVRQVMEELESSLQTAAVFGRLWAERIPLDDLAQTVPRLAALRRQEVQAALRRALHPDAETIVVVGDLAAVRPQLARLGLPAGVVFDPGPAGRSP